MSDNTYWGVKASTDILKAIYPDVYESCEWTGMVGASFTANEDLYFNGFELFAAVGIYAWLPVRGGPDIPKGSVVHVVRERRKPYLWNPKATQPAWTLLCEDGATRDVLVGFTAHLTEIA